MTTPALIKVDTRRGETWEVPRGFGAAYRRELASEWSLTSKGRPGMVISRITGMLAMIGYEADPGDVAAWPLRKRIEARVYALNVHERACEVRLPRHPRPQWLPEPWRGDDGGPTPLAPTGCGAA